MPKMVFKKGQTAWNDTKTIKTCPRCNKEFKSSPSDNKIYCSEICHRPPIIRSCLICNKEFRAKPSMIKRGLAKVCSMECLYIHRKSFKGTKSPAWKGDDAKYAAIHMWIATNFEKKIKCDFCGTTKFSRLEWANISKEYKRERNDWYILCPSCHRKYDRIK